MRAGVTVAIPSIPPRAALLARAVGSAVHQSLPPSAISISVDNLRDGAAINRQRALDAVDTEWTAFLDDDDEFYPMHIERLMCAALEQEADYVYSYFDIARGGDPLGHLGKVFDPGDIRQTTITVLVRTTLAKEVGFVQWTDDGQLIDGQRYGEDYAWTVGCVNAGGKLYHLPEQTWVWHRDNYESPNTSGRPDRW